MAGIFQSGLWTCGFDWSPLNAEIFTYQAANGGLELSPTPYSFGKSWVFLSTPAGVINLNVSLSTVIEGFQAFIPTLPTSGYVPLYEFWDCTAGSVQCNLSLGSSGQLLFHLGSGTTTAIGTASANGVIAPSVWAYVEIKATISSTVGFLECRVNGTTVITMSATQNTQSSANAWVSGLGFLPVNAGSNYSYIDDWYVLDTTGTSPLNTYLGSVQCRGEAPNANSAVGGRNAFTPTTPTGVNYTNVGNIVPSATEYNSSSTVNAFDMFRYPTLPSNVTTVFAVNIWSTLGLDTAGTRTVSLDCYSNGTDVTDTAFNPPAGNAAYLMVNSVDPHSSAAWTIGNAQAAELGVKVIT